MTVLSSITCKQVVQAVQGLQPLQLMCHLLGALDTVNSVGASRIECTLPVVDQRQNCFESRNKVGLKQDGSTAETRNSQVTRGTVK